MLVTQIDSKQLEKVADILKSIAHPLRINIVELLIENDRLSVNQICDILKSEQSLTSHHLNNLKMKGVLENERIGQNIYYSLKLKEVIKVINCMKECDL